MSLILEALKKSEQQRQREKAPSLQSIHQVASVPPKKTTQPWWLIAVLVVICNFAFFGYWFWQQRNTAAPTSPVAQTAVPVQQSAENNAAQTPPIQQHSAQEAQPEFTQISPRSTTEAPVVSDVSQRVYEINELPDNVRNNLPAMTFSFHVYSENPEQRTIIINDRRVREGEEVSPGLRLQIITQDGVVLLFQQHRIHISVLSDW